jgi:hypothetical protein
MFTTVCKLVNMYIHVCTMLRHVCTDLPILVQVVRIPDGHGMYWYLLVCNRDIQVIHFLYRSVLGTYHLEPCHDVDIDVLYPISVYDDIGIMKRRYRRFDL